MEGDDSTETTESVNRRTVLKTVSAAALGTALGVSVVGAEELPAEDGGIGAAECLEPTYMYRCVDSGCECSAGCPCCECDTIEQERLCCKDFQGNTHCYPWQDTGNCCESC